MKTAKQIKIAEVEFLRAFKEDKIEALGGTFYPFTPDMQREVRNAFAVTAIFWLLFIFLFYSTLYQDAVHYWHFDRNVFIGIAIVVIFLGGGIVSLVIALRKKKIAQKIEEKNHYYGVVITDEYYFENLPDVYQIISKANILTFSYAQDLKNGEKYLEFLVEVEGKVVTKGLVYDPQTFNPQEWVGPLKSEISA